VKEACYEEEEEEEEGWHGHKSSIRRPLKSIGIIRLAPPRTRKGAAGGKRGEREREREREGERERGGGGSIPEVGHHPGGATCVMVGGKFHSRNYHD